jgi:prepilin-type N-terminal cleavage/methylation domain-containing protein
MKRQIGFTFVELMITIGIVAILVLVIVKPPRNADPSQVQRDKAAPVAIDVGTGNKSSRVTVERIGIITDDLAYASVRGIYLITDSETGKEYLGVSGIGISELGSHTQSMGKVVSRKGDER